MELAENDAAALNLLLKASSKSVVVHVCRVAFSHRNATVPASVIAKLSSELGIKPVEANKLIVAVVNLVKLVLFENLTDAASISTVFPEDFHKNLRGLLSETLASLGSEWRSQALLQEVSLPRLIDFDWRVDVKTSSDSVMRMAVPTCLVQMKVQDQATSTNHMPGSTSVNVELTKQTLDTMLDGLGKIRDQLSSVAKATT
ncbi:COMM domain-containing protein 9-like [Dysidea avara]|uniref:COMM domain-containing protein 9-like n=1 Tax=Dysidea avara TaxID=196820 RepID=UPI00332CFAD0